MPTALPSRSGSIYANALSTLSLLYSMPKNALSARAKSNANANQSDTGKPKSGSRELTSPPVDDVRYVALL